MLEELLNSLQRKVAVFKERQEKQGGLAGLEGLVLDDASQQDAAELAQLWTQSRDQVPPEQTIAVFETLAAYYWCCWTVSSDEQYYGMALTMYGILASISPNLVPPAMQRTIQERMSTETRHDMSIGAVLAGLRESGSLTEIDEAISRARRDVAAAPKEGFVRANALSGLAEFLEMKFNVTNDLNFLNEAIQSRRDELASLPADHKLVSKTRYNLGNVLRIRFIRLGRRADIDEAISSYRVAVQETSVDDPFRASRSANLASAYQRRYERYHESQDLNDAIAWAELATSIDHPAMNVTLQIYAACLLRQFGETKSEKDLDKVIVAERKALALSSENNVVWGSILSNLGMLLRIKFELSGKSQHIDDALQMGINAYRTTDADAPSRAGKAMMLAATYATKYRAYGFPKDVSLAIELWREAAISNAPSAERIRAARDWGEMAADVSQWNVAMEAYAEAVQLLELLAWRGLGRRDQVKWLTEWGGMPSTAASVAIAAGEVERAVALLEQGHGILWSQLLSQRMDFESLGIPPELAAQLRETGRQLEEAWEM